MWSPRSSERAERRMNSPGAVGVDACGDAELGDEVGVDVAAEEGRGVDGDDGDGGEGNSCELHDADAVRDVCRDMLTSVEGTRSKGYLRKERGRAASSVKLRSTEK